MSGSKQDMMVSLMAAIIVVVTMAATIWLANQPVPKLKFTNQPWVATVF